MNLKTMVIGLSSDHVARDLIRNWEHDKGSLRFWRASSNFVYAFQRNQERYFLRFSTEQDHDMEQIVAELEFMQYLIANHFPCVSPVSSINDKLIETVQNSEGKYFAVVFHAAQGTNLDESLSPEQCEEWGRSLARLHSLSAVYKPVHSERKSWRDILGWIDHVLQNHPQEQDAAAELKRMTLWLKSQPVTKETYGLIHYDFQLDNVFYDEEQHSFNVIDFDDSFYSWYALDIVSALPDMPGQGDPLSSEHMKSFLKGYRSVRVLGDDFIEQIPYFQRFMNLYGFSRLLGSLDDSEMEQGPDWLEDVRLKFARSRDNLRQGFTRGI
ncbi:phosphotransferase enzyme family protein [Paenibacillus sp. J23TS9]|uniref:phosphotransferase enzyme family protein n=1 Tax=Paenibacillus sp. J23TS9 TaxID=2807193 RepID=UPI001FD2AD6A|nr:phosphotransferase [Paenibacillus sp. J23TS9]